MAAWAPLPGWSHLYCNLYQAECFWVPATCTGPRTPCVAKAFSLTWQRLEETRASKKQTPHGAKGGQSKSCHQRSRCLHQIFCACKSISPVRWTLGFLHEGEDEERWNPGPRRGNRRKHCEKPSSVQDGCFGSLPSPWEGARQSRELQGARWWVTRGGGHSPPGRDGRDTKSFPRLKTQGWVRPGPGLG